MRYLAYVLPYTTRCQVRTTSKLLLVVNSHGCSQTHRVICSQRASWLTWFDDLIATRYAGYDTIVSA